jgi:hypothetical protein
VISVLVIAPKHKARNHRSLDAIKFRHQFREKGLTRFVEQRPPSFFAIFWMHYLHAVGPFLWPIVCDLEGAEDVLLALQPLQSY